MNKNKSNSYGIHWFRRDLRVAGNPGLKYNWIQNRQDNFDEDQKKISKNQTRTNLNSTLNSGLSSTLSSTLGIFCFDQKFLSRKDFSFNRFQFFLETLSALKEEMRSLGGDLLVLNLAPEESFKLIIEQLHSQKLSLPKLITWNRDYEPFAIERDHKMLKLFKKQNIETQTFRDHLIIEPNELVKNGSEDEGYQVYSPFARKWLDQIKNHPEIKSRLDKKNLGIDYVEKIRSENNKTEVIVPIFNFKWSDLFKNKDLLFKDHLDDFILNNSKKVKIKIPKAGTLQAFKQLDDFKSNVKKYNESRDIPSLNGTSKMSIFLKNGSITTSQIIAYLNLKPYESKAESGPEKFLSEIIWREFYYHILFRKPEVEHEAFNLKYKNIKWQNNEKWFEAWKEGQTGFPIVDAGMRELKTTGWMHNRVRMIVASFLTKDLLIDWKWGEKYFMETLLDGDLAPNNGGWQWAASTGCDPQPYFRIFNPWSQGIKFDPECIYIKKFVPELKDTDPKNIHQETALRPANYPRPIVDHSIQRNLALSLYKDI